MHINRSSDPLYLNANQIQTTQCETHLGIQRTANAQNTATVEKRVKTGCRTAYLIMGAGLYGLNGISPAIRIVLIEYM